MNMVETQKSESIVSEKVIVRLLLFTAFSLFLFSESARMMLNDSSFNLSFNLLYIFFAILTIAVLFFKEYLDIRIALVAFAFLGFVIITLATVGHRFFFSFSVVISTMFFPFLTSGFRLPDSTFEAFLKKFIKAANIVCLSLVGIGIIDYLSGAGIQMFLARHHIFEIDQARMALAEHAAGIYRYYSFIGGPLTNAWYVLAFYALNILYNRLFPKLLNDYFVTSITLIGLVLCGSRTALIIGVFMFIFLNNSKYKAPYIFIISVISSALAMSPMFQKNLMQRFIIGTTTGDFSQGRNEALSRVFHSFVKTPDFFTGGGIGYSRQVTLMMGGFINSFEYPFMMFAYDIGIIGTILIYMLILVIPALICIKNKCYFLLLFLLAIVLYVNGFNAIANYADYMGQLCFLIMIMVNMSCIIKRRREEGAEN